MIDHYELLESERKLRRLIDEAITELGLEDEPHMGTDATDDAPGRDLGYGEGEGRMVKSHLDKIAKYATELHDMLRDSDDVPEWVSSKVAVMDHEMGRVKHYIEYKVKRMGDQ